MTYKYDTRRKVNRDSITYKRVITGQRSECRSAVTNLQSVEAELILARQGQEQKYASTATQRQSKLQRLIDSEMKIILTP